MRIVVVEVPSRAESGQNLGVDVGPYIPEILASWGQVGIVLTYILTYIPTCLHRYTTYVKRQARLRLHYLNLGLVWLLPTALLHALHFARTHPTRPHITILSATEPARFHASLHVFHLSSCDLTSLRVPPPCIRVRA